MSNPHYEQYNYQEIIQIGQECANLLQSQVFNMAYQAVLTDIQDRFFKCEPGHTKTLEELRREGNALARIGGQLQRAVAQAEQVIAQNNKQTETSEYAGFGVDPNAK